jgi:hypothetical protein
MKNKCLNWIHSEPNGICLKIKKIEYQNSIMLGISVPICNAHLTLVTLQAEDLPVRWFVTRTNSTWSPG